MWSADYPLFRQVGLRSGLHLAVILLFWLVFVKPHQEAPFEALVILLKMVSYGIILLQFMFFFTENRQYIFRNGGDLLIAIISVVFFCLSVGALFIYFTIRLYAIHHAQIDLCPAMSNLLNSNYSSDPDYVTNCFLDNLNQFCENHELSEHFVSFLPPLILLIFNITVIHAEACYDSRIRTNAKEFVMICNGPWLVSLALLTFLIICLRFSHADMDGVGTLVDGMISFVLLSVTCAEAALAHVQALRLQPVPPGPSSSDGHEPSPSLAPIAQ